MSWENLQCDCGREEKPSVTDLTWFLGLQTRQLVTKEMIWKHEKPRYLSNLEDAELLVYLIDEEMDIYIGVQHLAT
jgi:hypothetical protein